MTKYPAAASVIFDDIANNYGAYDIRNALSSFIAKTTMPNLRGRQLEQAASNVTLFFNKLLLFHKIRFTNIDPQQWLKTEYIEDVAHAKPAWINPRNRHIPARFDTVLVDCGNGGTTGIAGM